MKSRLFTILFLVFLFTNSSLIAQETSSTYWEYQAYPDLPFKLEHIQLDLHVQPEPMLIQGTGIFNITSRRPDVTQLIFNTSDLDIQEISTQGKKLEFYVTGDSLVIELADTLKISTQLELLIQWESSSSFGMHKDLQGNLWTSLNPKFRHHWMPIPDHPEVAATLNASITLPADMEVVFNGVKADDEVISTEEKTVKWTSKTPIPVSGISLAAGNFEIQTARAGVKEVSVYVPDNTLMTEVHSELLSLAVNELKTMENTFNFEYPYDELNIVVLPDHYWEEVQSGAGIIYLYQNLGSLPTQLKRGVAAQWLGNYHRYLEFPGEAYEFLRSAAISSDLGRLQNGDSLNSVKAWNKWVDGIMHLDDKFMLSTIRNSWAGLIQQFNGVVDWDDYASYWYDVTGIYWDDLPEVEVRKADAEEENLYTVTYRYDEMNNSLFLVFESQNHTIETLMGIEATAYGFIDTTRSAFSVTGQLDTIQVDIPQGIEYLILEPENDQNLKLVEYKPSMFLIRQLNSSEPRFKKEAAIQLRNNLDNPDLQLALFDALKEEQNPEVQAEILQTLALITEGANGTEQTFLQRLNTESVDVQLAGIKALSNYSGNEQVIYSVQNKLLNTDKDTVFESALNTLSQVADLDTRLSVVNRLKRMDNKQKETIKAIKAVVATDTTGKTLQVADEFMTGEYPYSIRREALQILLDYQDDSEYWAALLPSLQEDADPRIRYYSLEALALLNLDQQSELIENRLREELDPRVKNRLQKK